MKQQKLTAQILGMYIGRTCEIKLKNDYNSIDSDVINPALIGYHILGDVAITPHLRRLEGINDEEIEMIGDLEFSLEKHDIIKAMTIGKPTVWLFLLSRGFDLFGLIDAGLAKEVSE